MAKSLKFRIKTDEEQVKMLAELRNSKQDLLNDLKTIDINDIEWLEAREKAWTEHGNKYLIK